MALAVQQFVKDRWYGGDPCTRLEVYDEIRARDDTTPGSEFYKTHLAPGKKPALAGFLTRCLKRINFSARKNSISQVVPDTWRQDAEKASTLIRERLKDCDVIVNADQTFIRMYMEEEKVLAPTSTKRVGGKVNVKDKKTGFTVMVSVVMNSNRVCDPVIVFTGTKMKDAKRPKGTLDFKYQTWKEDGVGRTASVFFQKKHWFDVDICIRWLRWLKNQFPRCKIGLIWDHAPAHCAHRRTCRSLYC